MRHKKLYREIILFEKFIDGYKKLHNRRTFPRTLTSKLIELLFRSKTRYIGSGAFKFVNKIRRHKTVLALKYGKRKSITSDIKAYNRLPRNIRNRYFGKIYWRSKYFLLQKYGKKANIANSILIKLKNIGKKYGLTDIRRANIRKVQGNFKIVDANIKK